MTTSDMGRGAVLGSNSRCWIPRVRVSWLAVLGACCMLHTVACGSDKASGNDDTIQCGDGTVLVDGVCEIAANDGDAGASGSDSTTGAGASSGSGSSVGGSGSGGSGGSDSSGGSGTTADMGGSGGIDSGGAGGSDAGAGGTETGIGGSDTGVGGSGTSVGGSGADTGSGGSGTGTGGTGTGGTGSGGTGGSGEVISELLDCGSRDVTGATVVSGIVTGSTEWSGVVHVTGDLSVRNEATLTIHPGTKIIVALGATIEFGWEGSQPRLEALGTVEAPIRFCGEVDAPGYWQQLVFLDSVSAESTLQNVLIANAGGDAALGSLVLRAPIRLAGVHVRGSGTYGVAATVFDPGSFGILVHGSSEAAIRAISAGGVEVPVDTKLESNAPDSVLLDFEEFDADATFEAFGYPFELAGDIIGSQGQPEIVFQPGVSLTIPNSAALDFGESIVRVQGTSEARVNFSGLVRLTDSLEGSSIEYAEFSSRLAIDALASIVPVLLRHVTVADLLTLSCRLADDSSDISAARLWLTDCNAAVTLPDTTDVDEITADCPLFSLTGTVPNLGVPYQFDQDFNVSGSTLTLEPGVVFELPINGRIRIYESAGLSAMGTASDPITFTGAGFGFAEGFDTILVESSDVVFDHVVISGGGDPYGSGGGSANLTAEVPVSITNSTISYSSRYGILRHESDTTDYAATNTFLGNASADIGTLPPD